MNPVSMWTVYKVIRQTDGTEVFKKVEDLRKPNPFIWPILRVAIVVVVAFGMWVAIK
jgi:hypothetical protein